VSPGTVTRTDYEAAISITKIILFPATFRASQEIEVENTGAC
jgi:hypothetical protein